MSQNWSLYACIGVFAAVFAGGATYLAGQRLNQPEPEQAAAARPVKEAAPAPAAKENPAPPAPAPEDEAPRKVLVVRSRPVVLKSWDVTAPPQPRGDQEPNYENYFVREIGIHPSGTKVITRTNLEAVCWDIATGQRLRTFKAATRIIPRKPPDKPELHIDQEIRMSPDARFIALINTSGQQATILESDTGRAIGTYYIPKDQAHWLGYHSPAFTPESEYLLMAVKRHDKDAICAISTRTGAGSIVNLPRDWCKKTTDRWSVLAPVPRELAFIRHLGTYGYQPGDASGVYVLDLKTGKERVLKSIDFRPFSLFENRGIKVLPGGQYLSARYGELVIIDWKNDRLVTKFSPKSFHDEWFTPDGRRFAAHHVPKFIQVEIPSGRRLTPLGGWLELYDAFTGGRQLGEFVMERHDLFGLSTVGFSGDGKTMAVADRRTRVAIVDFEAAFGVPPLPPLPPPAGRESLPLR
jgi:hypothetical protein